jgi:hypothetical protein
LKKLGFSRATKQANIMVVLAAWKCSWIPERLFINLELPGSRDACSQQPFDLQQ